MKKHSPVSAVGDYLPPRHISPNTDITRNMRIGMARVAIAVELWREWCDQEWVEFNFNHQRFELRRLSNTLRVTRKDYHCWRRVAQYDDPNGLAEVNPISNLASLDITTLLRIKKMLMHNRKR